MLVGVAQVARNFRMRYLLKAVQGSGRGHTGDAGPVHGAQLHLRDVERHRGRLQPRLYNLQWTRQDGADCAPTAGQKDNKSGNSTD